MQLRALIWSHHVERQQLRRQRTDKQRQRVKQLHRGHLPRAVVVPGHAPDPARPVTVAELIERLRQMPQDMNVRYVADEPVDVTTVEVFQEPRSWGGAQWVRLD